MLRRMSLSRLATSGTGEDSAQGERQGNGVFEDVICEGKAVGFRGQSVMLTLRDNLIRIEEKNWGG